MKLKVLAVAVVGMFAFAGTAQGALSVPQPRSPSGGETFYVGTGAISVPLTAFVGSPTEIDFFEASLSSSVTSTGSFVDPLAYQGALGNTHDPAVDEAAIPALEFEPRGRLYNGSTSGTVYWHPYVSGCESVPSEFPPGTTRVECGIKKYGSTSSFNFTTVKAAPSPAPTPTPVAPSIAPALCGRWQSIDAIRLASARAAARKFNHAKTRGERNYWHAQLQKRARSLREAHGKVERLCA